MKGPPKVKKAFQSIAKVSHPDALHARLQSTAAHSHQRVVEEASERFRLAVRAYEMYDMKTGRWQPGLTSMINSHAARNMRQRMYEEPPFDLRRFSAPRLASIRPGSVVVSKATASLLQPLLGRTALPRISPSSGASMMQSGY